MAWNGLSLSNRQQYIRSTALATVPIEEALLLSLAVHHPALFGTNELRVQI